ncbi:GEVED domain-containing protein [Chryseobacterium sp. R2A-55]|uniref:GEVED domain-containing protein n=1 Tax=Chryseobacterium sp. R2A-55 TaxID=2744445 RepID=UPI001F2F1609|nr:GEVED domain-containing protein [Chryseobacterium sp. R2A-55]
MKTKLFSFYKITFLLICFFSDIVCGQISFQNYGTVGGTHTSQTSSTTFIPNPSSGTTLARGGATAPNAPVNLSITSNPLGTSGAFVKAAASSTASVTKFSPIVGYGGGTEFYTKFKVLFGDSNSTNSAKSGVWSFYQGNGTMYSDNADFTGSMVFTGLRFTFTNMGTVTLQNRNGKNWNTNGLSETTFSQGMVYTIEIVGNNRNVGILNYNYNGLSSTVAINSFDLYINGVLVGDDLAKAELANNSNIVSTTFIGNSSTNNESYLYNDDVEVYFPVPMDIGTLPAHTISTGTITGSTFCAGDSVSVPFTSSGTFNSGNVYAAELSNATGSFAAPVNIGTLSSAANSGTINAAIPIGTAAGNGYRIRVTASDPTVIGSNNGANLTVNVSTSPTVTSAAASLITSSSATLNGNVTGLGSCSALAQEKGFVYALNAVNANPTVGGTGVTKVAVATAPPAITTGAYNAPLSGLSSSTTYSYKSYAYDGANYFYGAVQNFVTLCGTPTPSGSVTAAKSCGSTALVYNFAAGEPAAGVIYYWQTTTNGTSMTNPVIPSIADPLKSNPYVVTTAQNYYIRGYDGNCWGTQISSPITVDTMPSITTQPSDQTVQDGSTATFNVGTSSSPIPNKQWQAYDTASSTWVNVGTNSVNLTTPATTLADEGKQYRVIVYNGTCQVISNTVTLHVINKRPNNASTLKSCIGNNQLTLSWTAPTTGATVTGYIVFALPGAVVPSEPDTSAGNASGYIADSAYNLATTYGTSGNLGKAVYKGSGTSATVTGLTTGQQYTFKVVAYNGETQTGWANGINIPGSWNQQYTVKVPEVANPAASVAPTSSVVSWNVVPASVGCYEYMVVASQGSVTLVPSGDGSAYNALTAFAGNNQVVYKGTGNTVTVTGLTEGIQYCYKIFVREVNSNQWSSGVQVCKTTGLSYCSSTANVATDDETGITNVKFNTIDNTSSGNPAYTDFTAISTDVIIGEVYDLSVKVNTLGYQTYTKAWIDWNRNGSFESGEVYDLGDAYEGLDQATAFSPLAITIPINAAVGLTRMRIATQYFYDDTDIILTPCQTGYEYGEVEDYTLNIIRAAGPEINVKGNLLSIPSGSTSVMGLNNTLFLNTSLGESTAEKDFTVENLGLSPLLLTGTPAVKLEGDNPSDFTVTLQPAASVAANGSSGFKIKFNPTTAGVLRATVSISNNDVTGNENPYTFVIQGTGTCSSVPSLTLFPTSGPANTVVSITSTPTDDLTGATVKYNGVALNTNPISPTQMEVTIPAGAENGNLVVRLATGCIFTQPFTVITKEFFGCEAASGTLATDLILYEVYDEKVGSGGYISIFNGTASAKNLANYEIYRAPSSTELLAKYTNGLSGNILPGELKIIRVAGANKCSSPASTGNGTIMSGFNDDDKFQLTNASGTTVYDEVQAPNYVGYYLKRGAGKLGNHPTYTASSWTVTPVSSTDCLPGGVAPALPAGNPPQITAQPQPPLSCKAKFSVTATEGFPGGKMLAYRWYMLSPGTNVWNPVTDNAQIQGANTSELSILSGAGLNDYQFYCQVREDGATCYTASNSIQFKDVDTTWNGTFWTKGAPNQKSRVIIAADYDTALHGSFEACTVTLNANYNLNIRANDYVASNYEVINLGSQDHFVVQSEGNLIQVNDNAANSGSITVKRNINVSSDRKQYNFLISPVVGANLKTNIYRDGSGNPVSSPSVQYYMESTNYFGESSGAYIAGRGLAVKEPLTGNGPFYAVFAGPPANGEISINAVNSAPGVTTPGTTMRGHNLIGNPYPSNLDLLTFYNTNGGEAGNLSSTFRFWDNYKNTTYSQMGSNYSGNSYASYNVKSATGTAATSDAGASGASKKIPGRYVKVGQGFFARIVGVPSKTLKFYNNSRSKEFEDDAFFGRGGSAMDRYWLKMITPGQLAVQMAVVYFGGGSNGFGQDDSFSSGGSDELYSVTDGLKIGINGRSPFAVSDRVPLGSRHYESGSYTIAIDQAEGIFANGQNIYLKDNQTGTVANLSEGSYNFSAGAGETTGRFEIIYEPQTILATDGKVKENLQVYRDGTDFVVKASDTKITMIEVFDGAGRLILNLRPNSTKAVIDGNLLSNGMYMLKIHHGEQVNTRKILK